VGETRHKPRQFDVCETGDRPTEFATIKKMIDHEHELKESSTRAVRKILQRIHSGACRSLGTFEACNMEGNSGLKLFAIFKIQRVGTVPQCGPRRVGSA